MKKLEDLANENELLKMELESRKSRKLYGERRRKWRRKKWKNLIHP